MKHWAWKLVGLGILAYLLWRVDWPRLGRLLAAADWRLFLASWLLTPLLLWLKTMRWRALLAQQGIRVPPGRAFAYYLAGLYLAVITPGRLGELARAGYLKANHGVGMGTALASLICDRALDLYLLVLAGAGGLALGWLGPNLAPPARAALAGVLLLPAALCLVARLRPWRQDLARLLDHPRVPALLRTGADDLVAGLKLLLTPRLLWPWVLTLASYALFFLQIYLLVRSLDIGIGYLQVIPLLSLASLASFLPIAVSGLGTREATLYLLLRPLGIGLDAVMGLSLGILAVVYVGTGILGGVAWWVTPLSREELSRLKGKGDGAQSMPR